MKDDDSIVEEICILVEDVESFLIIYHRQTVKLNVFRIDNRAHCATILY